MGPRISREPGHLYKVCADQMPMGEGQDLPWGGRGWCLVPALTTAPASQVLPTDELAEPKKSHRQSHRKKVLPEIYLTRLLSTKVSPASSPWEARLCAHTWGVGRALPLEPDGLPG